MFDNIYFLVDSKMISIIVFDFKQMFVIEVNGSCKNISENN